MKTCKKIFRIISISTLILIYSCEKPVTTSPLEPKEPLASISISSFPSGVKIFVDGRNSSLVTPDSLYWLSEGEHKFTLKLDSFLDTSFTAILSKDQNLHYDIDYRKNTNMYGNIYINTSIDSASVYIDGVNSGYVTPCKLNRLWPGEYEIKVTKPGVRVESKTVKVTSKRTSEASFYLKDTTYWVDYRSIYGNVLSDNMTCVAIDQNHIKWIGTTDVGVLKFDDHTWTNLSEDNSLMPSNSITDIKVDNFNNVWVGTTDGLVKITDNQLTVYNVDNNNLMLSNHINCIETEEGIDKVWIGTRDGLFNYQNNYWSRINSDRNSGLPHDYITAIKYDGNGNLWVGTRGFGLVEFSTDGVPTRYFNPDVVGFLIGYVIVRFHTNSISTIGASHNSVYFGHLSEDGAPGGMSHFDHFKWKFDFNGLPSNNINQIFAEKDTRRVWVCTSKGLLTYRYNYNYNRKTYNSSNTLMKIDNIQGIARDKERSQIWVATLGSGLYKFKRNFD